MQSDNPLQVLLGMREVIQHAKEATESYNFEDFNQRMEVLSKEAVELFRLFDRYLTDPDDEEQTPAS